MLNKIYIYNHLKVKLCLIRSDKEEERRNGKEGDKTNSEEGGKMKKKDGVWWGGGVEG